MNETRSNSRTKPKIGGNFKGGEINSLKDSEKTKDSLKYTYITTKRTWTIETLIKEHSIKLNNWLNEHKNIKIINIETLMIDLQDLFTQIIYK